MKRRLVYVLGLAMLISFSACSSDDDQEERDYEQGIVPRRISKMTSFDENVIIYISGWEKQRMTLFLIL